MCLCCIVCCFVVTNNSTLSGQEHSFLVYCNLRLVDKITEIGHRDDSISLSVLGF